LRKFKGIDEPVKIEIPQVVNARALTPTERFMVTSEEEREAMYRAREAANYGVGKDDDIPF
jgi:hypothetical protein